MRKACWVILAALAFTGAVVAEDYEQPYVIADSRVTPEYPPAAQAAGFHGTVTLAAVINTDGTVGAIEVVDNSSPKLGFEDAAIEAMQEWQFSPARLNGEPVDAVYAYVFHFQSPGQRQNSSPYVGGAFVVSRFIAGAGPSSGGKASSLTPPKDGGGFSPSSHIRATLAKAKVPPSCYGCLYDRTKLLPPRSMRPDGPFIPIDKKF